MSEAPERDAPEVDDAPDPEIEGDEPEVEGEDGEGEDDGEDEPAAARKKAEDWEKRTHNAEAARAREKSRRRAAERRAQELEARIERLESTTGGPEGDELLELIGSLSDDDEDPIGDIANVKRALKILRARQLQEAAEAGAQTQVQRQIGALRSAMSESEEDFAADHPDYFDAAAHYRNGRVEELRDAGYTGRNLERKLADDLFGIVRFALESGLDPAERVYALAQKRGFKPGMKAADRKLDKLETAREASRGVSGGERRNGSLSWADVAKLDGAARDKAWAKLREREMGRHGRH